MCIIVYLCPHRTRKRITHKHKGKWLVLNFRTEVLDIDDPLEALNRAKPRQGEEVFNTQRL